MNRLIRGAVASVFAVAVSGCAMSRPSPITLEYTPKAMPEARSSGGKTVHLVVEDRSGGISFEGRRSAGMRADLRTPLAAALKRGLTTEFQRSGISVTLADPNALAVKVVITRAALLYEDQDYWMTGKLLFNGELLGRDGSVAWSHPVEGTGRIQQMYDFSGDPSPRKVLTGALNASVAYFTKELILNGFPKLDAPPPAPAVSRAPAPAPAAAPAVSSDVDLLPAPRPSRKAHAVVIGIERYR